MSGTVSVIGRGSGTAPTCNASDSSWLDPERECAMMHLYLSSRSSNVAAVSVRTRDEEVPPSSDRCRYSGNLLISYSGGEDAYKIAIVSGSVLFFNMANSISLSWVPTILPKLQVKLISPIF